MPRGGKCSAVHDDDGVVVTVFPVDASLTREIEDFIQKRVPRGVECSADCDDGGAAVVVSLMDNPLTRFETAGLRRFSNE